MTIKTQSVVIQVAGEHTAVELKLEAGGWAVFRGGQRFSDFFSTSEEIAIAVAKKYVEMLDEHKTEEEALKAKMARELGRWKEVVGELKERSYMSGSLHYLGFQYDRGKIIPIAQGKDHHIDKEGE